MLASKLTRDFVQLVSNLVCRKMPSKMVRDVRRELSIAPSKLERRPLVLPAVAVYGDHDLAVIQERAQRLGVLGVDMGRGNMMAHALWLGHRVERRLGLFCGVASDAISFAFEIAPVKGTKADRATEFQFLLDTVELEDLGKAEAFGVECVHESTLPS